MQPNVHRYRPQQDRNYSFRPGRLKWLSLAFVTDQPRPEFPRVGPAARVDGPVRFLDRDYSIFRCDQIFVFQQQLAATLLGLLLARKCDYEKILMRAFGIVAKKPLSAIP
jgi:hypothetical protein